MKEFTYTIRDELGIHARPAGLLVKESQKYKSNVTLYKGAKCGDAKKLFQVMGLGVKQGDQINVIVEGEDEALAAEHLESFITQTL